jgi:hypothetical protein
MFTGFACACSAGVTVGVVPSSDGVQSRVGESTVVTDACAKTSSSRRFEVEVGAETEGGRDIAAREGQTLAVALGQVVASCLLRVAACQCFSAVGLSVSALPLGLKVEYFSNEGGAIHLKLAASKVSVSVGNVFHVIDRLFGRMVSGQGVESDGAGEQQVFSEYTAVGDTEFREQSVDVSGAR